MRSSTDPAFTGRCRRCFLQERVCICAHVVPVDAGFQLVVLRHWKEGWRSSNTGRLAGLAIRGALVLDYGAPGEPFDDRPLCGADTALLFPSVQNPVGEEPASAPFEVAPATLVVLDSTWSQARKLVRRIPALSTMRRLQVLPTDPPPKRLRKPPTETAMGTFEAVTRAVEVVRGPLVAQQLDRLHERFVRHALAQRGGLPAP